MADKTLPGLDAVAAPLVTDIILTRQAADTEDRRYTRAQLRQLLTGEVFDGDASASPALVNINSSATIANILPNKLDTNTGLGWGGGDILALIAGGQTALRLQESSSEVLWTVKPDVAITATPGGGQGGAVELISSYNYVTTVATDLDSVQLPSPFNVGMIVHVYNRGAAILDVFPAAGDDLGQGANLPDQIQPGGSLSYIGVVASVTWQQLTSGLLLPSTGDPSAPILGFGDGDTGFYENADDFLSVAIAGVREFAWGAGANGFGGVTSGAGRILNEVTSATNPTLIPFNTTTTTGIGGVNGEVATIISSVSQLTIGADGKYFVNTLTGVLPTGGNIETPTPANVEIFAAGTATNGVSAGSVELWGGYANNTDASGGNVILWGGGAGGGPSGGGDVRLFGGDADATPGQVELTGGTPTVGGVGGAVTIDGGPGFSTGAGSSGGRVDIDGGNAASGGGAGSDGGAVNITAGTSAAGGAGTGDGGAVNIVGGNSNSDTAGAVVIRGGTSGNTADGGPITITGGAAGVASGANLGGSVTITGGLSNTTSPGGAVALVGGAGEPGEIADGGAVTIDGGASGSGATGAGGAITITGGAATSTNGDGGDINLTPGAATGSGLVGQIIIPLRNNPALPSLAFGDGDTGIYEAADDQMRFAAGGSAIAEVQTTGVVSSFGTSWKLIHEGPTATNPTIAPAQGDLDTGIGGIVGADTLSLISGGVAGLQLPELNSNVMQVPDAQVGLTAFATGGQANATQVNASYAVFSTVATLADSGKLPPVFKVGTIVTIKNDGAADMDFFPATGDDLGNGTNVVQSIAVGEAFTYIATVADATWTRLTFS